MKFQFKRHEFTYFHNYQDYKNVESNTAEDAGHSFNHWYQLFGVQIKLTV